MVITKQKHKTKQKKLVRNKQATGSVTANDTFTATATTLYVGTLVTGHAANDTVTIDAGITVKEITNYTDANAASNTENSLQANNSVTYQNIAQDVRDTYTLIDDTWVGDELVVNGDFATDSDWASVNDSSGAWTISNGLANVNCTSNAVFKNSGAVIKTGTFYLFSYELKNYVSGSVRLRIGSGLGAFQSANGIHSQIIEGIASPFININFEANFSAGFIGSIDNVSVKEIIEVAS